MHPLSLVFLSHAHCRNPYSTNRAILLKRPRSIDYTRVSQRFFMPQISLSVLEDSNIIAILFLIFDKIISPILNIFIFPAS